MRLQILERIDKLEETHCQSCTIYPDDFVKRERYCITKCKIGKKLQECGNQLTALSLKKANDIIAKGQNMTTSDILYLLERGFFKKDIRKFIGMGLKKSSSLFRDIHPRGSSIKPKGSNKSLRKHVFELADAGITEKEVAQVLDMNKNTLSNYFSMWRKERDGKSN